MSPKVPPKLSLAARLPQSFAEAAADFERSKISEVKSSRRLAWIVAAFAVGVAVLTTATALVAVLMRTEPEPVILRVDNSTGATMQLRSIKDAQDQYDEVINKYWLAQYVTQCEGYEWHTIAASFEACKLMSESARAAEHSKKVQAPDSPLAVLKDKGKISIKITSIIFTGPVAQVRFTAQKLANNGENPDGAPLQQWIASAAFKFSAGEMTEQQRLINPLGFKVVSYRVDPEVIK